MKVAILLAMLHAACFALPASERIVGGSLASPGQFKHMVEIIITIGTKSFLCGGSILSPTLILTAAHCLGDRPLPQNIRIQAGVTDRSTLRGEIRHAAKYVLHPGYDISVIVNDIAIVKLEKALPIEGNIGTIELRETELSPGEVFTLTGWGLTSYPGRSSNDLQYLKLANLGWERCAREHPWSLILPSNVCTISPVGEGACPGDSGGPLIDAYGRQVGIVSWGSPCALGKPDVYTSVTYYVNWVREQVTSL